jgi:hypothetical protein
MKNKYILGGFAALTALASSASADQTIDITGATAFRTAAVDSIIASFGAGLDDFAHTGAAGLAGIRGARQAIFKGDFPGLPDKTIIRCTWTGSVEGIQTVGTQINQDFLPESVLLIVPPTSGVTADTTAIAGKTGTATVPVGTDLVIPDLAFSDVYPSSSPYDVSNVVDSTVGVVVFTPLVNEGAPTGLTNVTAGQVRTLFGTGNQNLNYLFPTTDTRKVYATGRSDFSGTRTTYLAESGYSISAAVQQNKPVTNGASASAATLAISTLQIWPTNDGTNKSLVWGPDAVGNGGFESGSSLRTAFGATTAAVQRLNSTGGTIGSPVSLLMFTVLGIGDATTAITNGAKALSYNGVGIAPASPLSAGDIAKITEGAYTMWGYQHLMYNSTNDTPEMQAVLAELTTQIPTNIGTAGIDVGLMNVSRIADGGTVAP